ncbi:MAG: HAMP domain-containing protein, partial [Oceanospirillales bacterium]
MSLYKSIEKAFWHTLTRKIIGNVVFLLLPHIVLIVVGGYYASDLKQLILSAQLESSTESQLMSGLNSLLFAASATIVFAFVAGIFTIFFMRHLFLKPIHEMTKVLKAIREKEGDISATLPAYTYDEISDMARSYNDFTDQLRAMI